VSDRSGCPVRERISSLVTNSEQCMLRMGHTSNYQTLFVFITQPLSRYTEIDKI